MKRIFLSATAFAAIVVASSAFMPASRTVNADEKNIDLIADAPTAWTIDKAHSNVKFNVTHLVVSEVEGSFKLFDGSMENTKADFSDAKVNFTVDVNSLTTTTICATST
jgi:polyisoprenoid-binding protein YceI